MSKNTISEDDILQVTSVDVNNVYSQQNYYRVQGKWYTKDELDRLKRFKIKDINTASEILHV